MSKKRSKNISTPVLQEALFARVPDHHFVSLQEKEIVAHVQLNQEILWEIH